MDQPEFDLNALLACCRRELAFRTRVYPRMIDKGTISEAKAGKEIELMRLCCDYFVEAIFRNVTRQPPPLAKAPDDRTGNPKAAVVASTANRRTGD